MEKMEIVAPATDEITNLGMALKLKSEFIKSGFKSRSAFFTTVQGYFPEFKDYHNLKLLERWWSIRLSDAELNQKLETVLNKLGHE